MSKNLWESDYKNIFKKLTREYQREGYSLKEARGLAKREAEELIADRKYFIDNLLDSEEDQ
tara:strand:- start:314 stop:496 length:183 start_codon:yes stop_codon:yes gene_type:complete